jgi:glutaconate CoA-transferase subunit B
MAEAAKSASNDYSIAELMTVAMARVLGEREDGKLGGVGAAAVVPMAAARLATLTTAPNLWWFCGGASGLNPTFDRLPKSSADPRAALGSTGKKNMLDVVDMGITGGWDWGFNGGLQIDMYGNINMIGIGTYPQLKVRGPGTVGTIWTGTLRRPYLYTMHHAARVLVETCDYISGPGYISGGQSRWDKVQNTTEGPQLLFTPMAILDFDPDSRRMRLKSVHPGYSADDVQKNTGFELIMPKSVPTTEAPTQEELFVLRRHVDRDGVLKNVRATVG